ncbi:hypothetical protein CEXT_42961 [Caerostris extrusa]|uniref:Uncharacterized protein n=1 Tax=Caerostris extrusa TaxID=172846 RepID=A0AAV4XMB0_CAEEX|nr:hypothetical protein CEXT_42961 [Caerostris extrusa]
MKVENRRAKKSNDRKKYKNGNMMYRNDERETNIKMDGKGKQHGDDESRRKNEEERDSGYGIDYDNDRENNYRNG